MSYSVFLIPSSDKGHSISALYSGAKGTLDFRDLQKWVDCTCIQILRLKDDMALVIDDNGKCLEKPINHLATVLYCETYGVGDFIVGDALLCSLVPPKGYTGEPDVFGFYDDHEGYKVFKWLFNLDQAVKKVFSEKPGKGGC